MSAQSQRRRPRDHAAAQAQRVRRARATANAMSPPARRAPVLSPDERGTVGRVMREAKRAASPQVRRVITLDDAHEESKDDGEVARLEAQLEDARRRAYAKRTGKPPPPQRKVQFAESGDWSESWQELAEEWAAKYPEATPPPASAPGPAPAPLPALSEDGRAFRQALAEKADKLAAEMVAKNKLNAEAEAKAAEERRAAREAEDATNRADPATSYCGLRLVGRLSSMMSGDRPLPPIFKCGVCQSPNEAAAVRCTSCAAARVAPWQRVPGGLLRAGAVLKARDYADVVAIVASVGRMRRKMKVVLFAPECAPEVGDLMLNAIAAEWTLCAPSEANAAIRQRMLCWGLCPKCEHVFHVQNGDIANRDVRAKELPKVTAQREADEKLLGETEALKEELKAREPLPTAEILACTAEIKRLRTAIRGSKVRAVAVQDWCPRCLNRDFDFFPKDVWPTP